jgi:hypothetical protein
MEMHLDRGGSSSICLGKFSLLGGGGGAEARTKIC